MQLSILKIILYILIPFAPLYARIVDFNGSLDHAWTMFPLFNVAPFSIVPILMMAFGKINKGKGGKPYDNLMWIPVVLRFIISLIGGLSDSIILKILCLVFSILSVMIPNLMRRNNLCKENESKENEKSKENKENLYNIMDQKQIYKSFVDSLFEVGFGEIFTVLIIFVPFIGIFFKILGMIPFISTFINDIIWCFGFICGYIIVNMFNQDDIKDMCYPDKFNNKYDIIKLVFGSIFLLGSGIFSMIGRRSKASKIGKIGKIKLSSSSNRSSLVSSASIMNSSKNTKKLKKMLEY
jgi:hypothetical protein